MIVRVREVINIFGIVFFVVSLESDVRLLRGELNFNLDFFFESLLEEYGEYDRISVVD